jgi:hypothetical protein
LHDGTREADPEASSTRAGWTRHGLIGSDEGAPGAYDVMFTASASGNWSTILAAFRR